MSEQNDDNDNNNSNNTTTNTNTNNGVIRRKPYNFHSDADMNNFFTCNASMRCSFCNVEKLKPGELVGPLSHSSLDQNKTRHWIKICHFCIGQIKSYERVKAGQEIPAYSNDDDDKDDSHLFR